MVISKIYRVLQHLSKEVKALDIKKGKLEVKTEPTKKTNKKPIPAASKAPSKSEPEDVTMDEDTSELQLEELFKGTLNEHLVCSLPFLMSFVNERKKSSMIFILSLLRIHIKEQFSS